MQLQVVAVPFPQWHHPVRRSRRPELGAVLRCEVLYSRPGCHLCDAARDVLVAERARTPFEFEEVDVEGDDALELEYGIRIPVVTIDGEERFEYEVDPARASPRRVGGRG